MWMKIDDGLHAHRKTRTALKSHEHKRRDAAPMGLWVLAGSWASQNGTDGWVPDDELDRFDEDWSDLVDRLVAAEFWWPQERDGESGFGFNDWHDYNPESQAASKSGTFGNHVRWHQNKGLVATDCEHCPTEPDHRESAPEPDPDSGGDIGGRSGGESGWESRSIALPVPDPTRPEPDPSPLTTLSDKSDDTGNPDRFDEFWETYSLKEGKKTARTSYAAALKKPGVTADLLVAAAAAYITWQMSEGKHPTYTKHPTTWLRGEHWRDERPARRPEPESNVQGWLRLVNEANEAEGLDPISPFKQLGGAS